MNRTSTIGIAAALGLALATTAPSGAAELALWRHGTLDAKSDAGILFMAGQGFAEKQGLKLEIVQFHNDIVEVQALLAGELDSYEASPGSAIVAAARGADVKVIGCPWPGLTHVLFVRNDIESVEDLRGKTIAVGPPSSLPDIFARAVLAQHHIPLGDVQLANLGNDPDRYRALVAGVAQATVVTREFEPVAAHDGVKLMVSAEEALPNDLRICTEVTGKTLSTRRADAIHFVAAEAAALRYALTHREEALALTRTLTHAAADNPRPAYIYDWAVANHVVDPDFAIPLAKLGFMEDELVKLGNIVKPFDIATMTDPGVREKALEIVGQ